MNRTGFFVGFWVVAMLSGCSNPIPDGDVVTVGKVDAARSTVDVDRKAGVVADGTDAVQVTVTARDADGNLVSGASVVLTAKGEGALVSASPATDENGVSRATLTSTRAQEVTLTATVDGVIVKQTPTVAFEAVKTEATAKLSFIAQPSNGTAGTTLSEVVVQLTGADGEPASDVKVPVTLALGNAAGDATLGGTATASSAGGVVTFADLVVDKAGTGYTLVASAEGFESAHSDAFDIAPAVPAALDPSASTFTASAASVVADGVDTFTLTVVVIDVQGKPRAGQAVLLASTGDDNTLEPATGTTDSTGTFTATMASTKAEAKTVTATVETMEMPLELSFTPGAPSLPGTTFTASRDSVAVDEVDDLITLTIVAKDAFNNVIVGQAVSLESTGDDDTLEPATGTTDGTGTFTATMTATKAEEKTVTATLAMVEIPLKLTFTPGAPSLPGTTFTASRNSVAVDEADDLITLTIVAKDKFNNAIAGQAVSLASTGEANALESGDTDDTGTFTTTFTSTKAEVKTVTAVVGSVSDALEVEFLAGAPDPETSSVSALHTSVLANGTSQIVVDIVVRDAFENPVRNAGVSLEVNSADTVVNDPANTDASGKSSGSVSSSVAGDETIQVFAEGIALLPALDVTFEPAASIGGMVSGLWGTGLVLVNNDEELLPIEANGPFVFEEMLAVGATYDVSIASQPTGQTCILTNGQGSTSADAMNDIRVKCAVEIAIGPTAAHTMALEPDGTLWAWGKNDYGQLGVGSTNDDETLPMKVGTDFAAVAVGGSHTVAVKTDGTLWAWGRNNNGQLGNGESSSGKQATPLFIDVGAGFASVAAGRFHSMAIKTDGTLWAWGSNHEGQAGIGTTRTMEKEPVKVASDTGFASVGGGEKHTIALKTDGTVWAWGRNDHGQLGDDSMVDKSEPVPIKVDPAARFASIAAGGTQSFAIMTDGTLLAWGQSNFGQLGTGTTADQKKPVQVVTETPFASVAAGTRHTVALKTDGTVWAWGSDENGRLGDGSTILQQSRPVPIEVEVDTPFASVSAGEFHSVALRADTTLWAWGFNGKGQLGDGTKAQKATPGLVEIVFE